MVTPDPKTVGFIDIGTNSVHLLVVRYFGDSLGTPIYQDKEVVRPGRNLFSTGLIDLESLEKTRVALCDFVQRCRDLGAEEIVAVATCAAREAQNKKEFVKALDSCGVDVRIISGQEEARLIRLGVFGAEGPKLRSIEIDIGGGSTEISISQEKEDLFSDSLSMGAVRFAYGDYSDPNRAFTPQEYDMLRRKVDLLSYRAVRKVAEIGFVRAYGSSGTLIALAELCAVRRGDGDASYMMYYELVQLMRDIYPLDSKQRAMIPGMNPSRADIIVAGGAIAEELMYLLEIDRIEISPNGLKQGMEVDYLLNSGTLDFNVRDAAVLNLANRCQYDEKHAKFVQKNSLLLFDRMMEEGIHDMGDRMRSLLSYAALLHDIGEFICYSKHNIHSYTIIINSDLPGFSEEELRTMALIVRFHHKKFPTADSKHFADMDVFEADNIIKCAMILRMADIMDRHRNSRVETFEVTVSDDTFILQLNSEYDVSMIVWQFSTIAEDFRNVFGLELKIIRA